MKLDITEEEFQNGLEEPPPGGSLKGFALSIVKGLGVTFKQEIDWEAETHDPSVIPKNWLIEGWANGDNRRELRFHNKHISYDNYRAIKKEDWPKWAIDANKGLEG